LGPSKKSGNWTDEEDRVIWSQKAADRGWTEIAEDLDGRTSNCCKNRWYSKNRKQERHTKKSAQKREALPTEEHPRKVRKMAGPAAAVMEPPGQSNSGVMLSLSNNDGLPPMEKPVATHVGRWSPHEHTIFLEGMRLYPKQWDKIAKLVKTRTAVQIRTHSQKYL
jgi:hypothetical protein